MAEIIREKQDMTHLVWGLDRRSSGTAGTFLKSYSELGGKKIYYKLSNYDPLRGVTGFECVNELVVCRLLNALGIEHLDYDLIHADIMLNGRREEVYMCASEDFKNRGESKIVLDLLYGSEHIDSETPLEFCLRMGWGVRIWEMLAVDYLILNRDRHGANMEALRLRRRGSSYRLAPLFDHGLSLLFGCAEEALSDFDVLEDRAVQSFVGGRSAEENLALIPPACMPSFAALTEDDMAYVFSDLDGIISGPRQEKTREMIRRRLEHYEDLRDKAQR